MQLYNTLSAKDRALLIEEAGEERLTLSFYKYAQIGNPHLFRDVLFHRLNTIDVLGRIYVAHEGINAQMSIPAKNLDMFKDIIDDITFLKGVRLNIAIEQDNKSFLKLTIKVRSKILADGLEDDIFDVTQKGVHVNAKEFNEILEKENTICVDMRNHYESEIGHFDKAITPDVDTFRESLPIIEEDLTKHKKDKNILMYCTGGIRCEKASAYFKHKGFQNVYQLEGGIIDYVRQVKSQDLENKFIGKNFVFDQRRGERVSKDIISKCHQCGVSCDTHVNCANEACHLLFIQCESCQKMRNKCCSSKCQESAALPLDEKRILRKGIQSSNKIFKKGRSEILKFKQ